MDIFENLENLPVSEACFDDIIGIIEEIISETKKANKEEHQEAIFKKLNPKGEYAPIGSWSNKNKIKNLTNVTTGFYNNGGGVAHTMRDYRDVSGTDTSDSAPFSEDGKKVKSFAAQEVRRILGRDDKFSNEPAQPSKSHKVAQKYMEFKKAVKDAKGK